MHSLETRHSGRDFDLDAMLLHRRTRPQVLLRLEAFQECQLREEQGENDKDLSKGNGSQRVSGHFREPVGAGTIGISSHPKVAQQLGQTCGCWRRACQWLLPNLRSP